MLKKTLSILFLSIIFFLSCKKDAPTYHTPIIKQADSAKPFILQDEISPNPNIGVFTIKTNTTDSQNVIMIDMLGRQVFNLTIKGTTAIVDNNLINGIYIVHISGKHGVISRKIIVSK
jgi:hypothetical protein